MKNEKQLLYMIKLQAHALNRLEDRVNELEYNLSQMRGDFFTHLEKTHHLTPEQIDMIYPLPSKF